EAPERGSPPGREWAHDLRGALGGPTRPPAKVPLATAPGRAPPPRSVGRSRRVSIVAVATVILVAVAGAVLLGARDRGSTPGGSPSVAAPTLIREGVQATASRTAP